MCSDSERCSQVIQLLFIINDNESIYNNYKFNPSLTSLHVLTSVQGVACKLARDYSQVM